MINIENIRKLNTHEDSRHFHKILGSICLLNFCFRYINFFMYQSMNLENYIGLYCILLHWILSISSLIFKIPSLRNPLKPMIFPEFRLHSIIFTTRSIITCFIYYNNLHYVYIIGTCYCTMIIADIATKYYNRDNKNGSTMRNMPFDNTITMEDQKKITFMHSCMQIGATTFMFGNIDTAFSPLLAIQLAAFSMTLVRKSIISSKMWHSVYTLTLWINYFLFLNQKMSFIIIQNLMYNNYRIFFFPYRINKYISWSINFCLLALYREFSIEKNIDDYFINNELIIFYIKFTLFSFILINNYIHYRTLFII